MTRNTGVSSSTIATVVVAIAIALAAPDALAQKINVNTATKQELEDLPGIGPKLAEEIIRDRQENGAYGSVEDLARVPGISSALVEKLQAHATTSGGGVETVVVKEGEAIPAAVVEKVLAGFAGEPLIREVQDAAIEYARAHPDEVDSWRLRVRTNALLPEFRVRNVTQFDRDVRTRTNQDAEDAVVQTEDNDNSLNVELRATWKLNKIIFDKDELGVWRESMRMANLRDRVVDEVTRRYYERRRLQVDLALSPPTELGDRVRKELRIQELTADLDALTGGWFSGELDKQR